MKIGHFFKEWGMTIRQFLLLFLTALVIFSVLMWENTAKAADAIRTSDESRYSSLAKDACSYLDIFYSNLGSVLLAVSSEWRFFQSGQEENALEVLRNYNDNTNYSIRTLYFLRTDGSVLCGKQTLYDIMGNPYIQEIYKSAIVSPFGMRYTDPYYSPISGNVVAFFSTMKTKNGDLLGVLVAECDLDILKTGLSKRMSTSSNSYALLSASNASIVYDASYAFMPTLPGTYPAELSGAFLAALKAAATGFSVYKDATSVVELYKTSDNKLHWPIVLAINKADYDAQIQNLYNNLYLSMAIWFFILLAGSLTITVWMTRPMRNIVMKMRSIRNLSDLSEIKGSKTGEINQLINSYNFMIRSIHNLKNDCQIYELKMLRSQIGPHFLYNTLSCISILAKQKRVDEVRHTVQSLIDLLSFSFDRQDEFVELEDELSCIADYVYIQKIRFGNTFTYLEETDKRCGKCLIPKMTLQPFIENAILHGIISSGSLEKRILVRSRLVNGRLVLFVADNGVGMSAETLRNVTSNDGGTVERGRFSSIGIHNVDQRMKLYYGPQYDFRIRSYPGVGTVVRLVIPAKEGT